MITASYLRKILSYNAKTGIFRWIAPRPKVQVGAVAGYTDKGRRFLYIDGRAYLASRVAWLYVHGRWPKDQIDHINCVRDDDRIANLREATGSQNQANRPVRSKSGFKGVVYRASLPRPWMAQICKDNRYLYLGCFASAKDAHKAYVRAAKRLHGRFARAA